MNKQISQEQIEQEVDMIIKELHRTERKNLLKFMATIFLIVAAFTVVIYTTLAIPELIRTTMGL